MAAQSRWQPSNLRGRNWQIIWWFKKKKKKTEKQHVFLLWIVVRLIERKWVAGRNSPQTTTENLKWVRGNFAQCSNIHTCCCLQHGNKWKVVCCRLPTSIYLPHFLRGCICNIFDIFIFSQCISWRTNYADEISFIERYLSVSLSLCTLNDNTLCDYRVIICRSP